MSIGVGIVGQVMYFLAIQAEKADGSIRDVRAHMLIHYASRRQTNLNGGSHAH